MKKKFYCSEEEMARAISKHSKDFIEMLIFYRDNCSKKARDDIFRSYRRDLMRMINGEHSLLLCHEEKD